MSQKPRRRTRNEKIFYILSILLVISMVVGLIAVAITPTGVGF
jgi:cell division protein FtsL